MEHDQETLNPIMATAWLSSQSRSGSQRQETTHERR